MDYKVARIGPKENREIDLCISAFVLFKESRWPLFCVCAACEGVDCSFCAAAHIDAAQLLAEPNVQVPMIL